MSGLYFVFCILTVEKLRGAILTGEKKNIQINSFRIRCGECSAERSVSARVSSARTRFYNICIKYQKPAGFSRQDSEERAIVSAAAAAFAVFRRFKRFCGTRTEWNRARDADLVRPPSSVLANPKVLRFRRRRRYCYFHRCRRNAVVPLRAFEITSRR